MSKFFTTIDFHNDFLFFILNYHAEMVIHLGIFGAFKLKNLVKYQPISG